MAGFVTFSLAGLGFLVVAAVESLPPKPSPLLRHAVTGALSSLFIVDSIISALSHSPSPHHDPLTPLLPLTTLAAAALFLLHSLAGLLPLPRPPPPPPHLPPPLPLPPPIPPPSPPPPPPLPILDLLLLFAFLQEILLLSVLRPRTDPDGLEHRYLDLLLVPALTCAAATAISLQRPSSPAPRLARAAGLALHGTWFIQMAFAFFSTARAHGCSLLRQSRAHFTVLCKAHADSHRGRAIAGLQFNFHLAFLLVVGLGLYAVTAASRGRTAGYRPLNKEMRRMENVSALRFTLDSDNEVEVEMNGVDQLHVGENGLNGSH